MDAVEFLKSKIRMCILNGCTQCPISDSNNGTNQICSDFIFIETEKAVKIVEQWAKEHPSKTRQSEFLKMYPNAKMEFDKIGICPQMTEGDNFNCIAPNKSCDECRKKYWLEEIE